MGHPLGKEGNVINLASDCKTENHTYFNTRRFWKNITSMSPTQRFDAQLLDTQMWHTTVVAKRCKTCESRNTVVSTRQLKVDKLR